MKELKVLKLINNNLNTWEDILSSHPYNLIIKHKGNFVLLKYNQIESDMSNPIVQECRGIILKKEAKYKVASMRFTKFFNYGQKEAVKLDFSKPVEVSQKIDGSLLSLFYDNDTGWHISTSGNIDAEDSPLQFQKDGLKTYLDLFLNTISFNIEDLNKNYTYMFELVSPYNRVIVPYKQSDVYLLAIRNNNDLKEEPSYVVDCIGRELKCKLPKKFNCENIKEAIKAVEKLKNTDEHFEGFVLRDCNDNRIKLKSVDYMNLFFIKGDGVFSRKKILKIILDEADDDILGHFPEYTDDFDDVRRNLSTFITLCKAELLRVDKLFSEDKKTFAMVVKTSLISSILFKAYGCSYKDKTQEEKGEWLKSQIMSMPIQTLLNHIEQMEGINNE